MTALGIDTSNYTTSAAVFDGTEFAMSRKILDVKAGMRGIRQSDGVFMHNRALPAMLEERLAGIEISAVGVSTRPRSVDGSYMPVFTVGHGYARAVAAAAGVPLFEYSHQDGHIMAGVFSAGAEELLGMPFISVHLSGGTTEILKSEYNGHGFTNKIVGGTLDISAGQLIDRIGVYMGMKFPCGRELEELADTTEQQLKLPFSVNGGYVNLSGIETKLAGMIKSRDAVIARTTLVYVRDALVRMLENVKGETGTDKILLVGGVASNGIIRDGLSRRFGDDVYFASKALSSDNAVGVAALAYRERIGDKNGRAAGNRNRI